ncbi:S1 family peptidase [Streptomyces sp. SID13031]|uniref:S1 family peptidase n=1 Tax=Streptomyces sp. SID13031 TaxID=2706046 RepID=UPI0013CCCF8C|nr:S1 family peptidase [Streptomyces sp. SID13031]NEA36886.1 hypothetical protein [Streptomyces sp. SID13031]
MVNKVKAVAVAAAIFVASGSVAQAGQAYSTRTGVELMAESALLQEADSVIHGLEWHPNARNATFSVYLDPSGNKYRVSFAPEDMEIGQALIRALGDRVDVSYELVARTQGGRLADAEAHFGGAKVRGPSGANCTSGFTVVFPGGNWGSVTAGHCANNGDELTSGPERFGVATGEWADAEFDMIAIEGGGVHTPRIYTDPRIVDGVAVNQSTVVAAEDPIRTDRVCVSGAITGARCGAEVTSLNAEIHDSDEWIRDLIVATSPGVLIVPGDSGAPLYSERWGNTVAINGMVIAREGIGRTIYAHKVSTIEDHLSVQVETEAPDLGDWTIGYRRPGTKLYAEQGSGSRGLSTTLAAQAGAMMMAFRQARIEQGLRWPDFEVRFTESAEVEGFLRSFPNSNRKAISQPYPLPVVWITESVIQEEGPFGWELGIDDTTADERDIAFYNYAVVQGQGMYYCVNMRALVRYDPVTLKYTKKTDMTCMSRIS